MPQDTLPFGHPSTLREAPPGGFPCKGSGGTRPARREMTAAQITWMKENKPKYFTGDLMQDMNHLPQHLRFDG